MKKTYSVLSQAFMFAKEQEGSPEDWGIIDYNSPDGSENIYNKLAPHLKIVKYCGQGKGCFASGMYKSKKLTNYMDLENDTSNLGLTKFTLANGASVYIQARSADCSEGRGLGTSLATQNICAFIGVDINGSKKPNAYAHDVFIFLLTKYGIVPRGVADMSNVDGFSFQQACLGQSVGWACAAWVIYNENLDYLRCPEKLGWDKAKKCKE